MALEIKGRGRWEGSGAGGSSTRARGRCNTYTGRFEDQLSSYRCNCKIRTKEKRFTYPVRSLRPGAAAAASSRAFMLEVFLEKALYSLVTASRTRGVLTLLSLFSSFFPLLVLSLRPPQLPCCYPFVAFSVQIRHWPVTWHASGRLMQSIGEAIVAASPHCV